MYSGQWRSSIPWPSQSLRGYLRRYEELSQRSWNYVYLQFHISVTLTTEMRALPYIVARLLGTELQLSVLALLYVLRVDIEILDLETMGNINAMQHQDNRFASLETDRLWVVGKSLRGDLNSPG